MPPLAPAARAALEAEWLALVRHDLPALAVPRGWPITLDHCFARVLLDNAVGGCWYDVLDRLPVRAARRKLAGSRGLCISQP